MHQNPACWDKSGNNNVKFKKHCQKKDTVCHLCWRSQWTIIMTQEYLRVELQFCEDHQVKPFTILKGKQDFLKKDEICICRKVNWVFSYVQYEYVIHAKGIIVLIRPILPWKLMQIAIIQILWQMTEVQIILNVTECTYLHCLSFRGHLWKKRKLKQSTMKSIKENKMLNAKITLSRLSVAL